MNHSRILVTGAGGMLGRAVVAELTGQCDVVGFDLVGDSTDVEWHTGDITDYAAVSAAMRGCTAVLHIAAIPNIVSGTAVEIVRVNTVGTWNVFDAAREQGIGRVVLCSSDSVVGFTVRQGLMVAPDYLPVDEFHPLRPTDAYATSKKLGEELARSFIPHGISTVALRPVFIAHPESLVEIEARARDPEGYQPGQAGGAQPAAGGAVWHYVDTRDVARSFRLALELDTANAFEPFFISAGETLSPEPTLERLQVYLERALPDIRNASVWCSNPYAPLYDLERATTVLGFEAEHSLRGLVERVNPRQ